MSDAGALTIKAVHDGRVCVLTVSGDLDLLSRTEFLMHAARVVDDRIERFVLDLAGLTFLDCGGVRALVAAVYFVPSSCPVIIRSLSPSARRILELLGLDVERLRQEPDADPERGETTAWLPNRPEGSVVPAAPADPRLTALAPAPDSC
jgi:anti-anti-sigma factor